MVQFYMLTLFFLLSDHFTLSKLSLYWSDLHEIKNGVLVEVFPESTLHCNIGGATCSY